MLTNKELLEAVIAGRTAANDVLFQDQNAEQVRSQLSAKYDLTDGLYATPFVFGFHMVMIEESPQ